MKIPHTQYNKIAKHIDDSVIITDVQGTIIYVNPAFEQYTLFSKIEAIGQSVNILNAQIHDDEFFSKMWSTIANGNVFKDVVISKDKQGRIFYESKKIAPLTDNCNEIIGYLAIGKYIGDQFELRIDSNKSDISNTNTDEYNRILLIDRLYQSIARAKWNKRNIAVVHFDIDNFKLVNEAFGFTAGDQILQDIAARLRQIVRSGDTIAHCYGDEYMVILQDIALFDDIPYITNNIQQIFDSPYQVEDQQFYLTSSMGISVYPEDGKTPDLLLNRANSALHRAKQQGKNNQYFYTESYQEQAINRLTLNTCLRHALRDNEFSIHYQPQISPKDNKMTGVEALLRWNSAKLGQISPVIFIPLLEESGLISEVGEWALIEACKQVCKWQLKFNTNIDLSVNISVRQFGCGNLHDIVLNALESTRLSPNSLELEITESTLLKNDDKSLETLSKLSKIGVRLAIDDFGTGYSSFMYLKRFNVNTIKLDKLFIDDIDQSTNDKAIVTSMITMAHQIGLRVVAEGVENKSQLEILKDSHCDLIQGFLYSPPLTPEKIEYFIEFNNFECNSN